MSVEMDSMECVLCLGVEDLKSRNINLKEKCPIQEYLRVCTKYLNMELDFVNDEMDSPLCTKCIPQVEELFKIHQQLQEITNKMKEFSNTFSLILLDRRNLKSKGRTGLDDLDIENIKEELSEGEMEVTDSFVYGNYSDPGEDNNILQNYSETNKLIVPDVTLNTLGKRELQVRIEKLETANSKATIKPVGIKNYKGFSSQDDYNDEDQSIKSRHVSLYCSKCNRTWKNRKYFDAHCLKHVKEEEGYQCKSQKISKNEKHLQKHQKSHSCKRNHVCDVCGQGFFLLTKLNYHKRDDHNQDFNKKVYKTGKKSRDKTTSVKQANYCDVCNKTFSNKSCLDDHKRIHTGDQPYTCDMNDCKMTFRTKKNLRAHQIDFHTSEYPFVCEHENCDAKFKFRIQLYNHTVTFHPSLDKLHVCETCGNSFKRAGDLRAHMAKHFTELQLDCTYCNLKCKTSSQLTQHVKIVHLKEHKYVCDICGKRTWSARKLGDHVRTHTGEKPFECPYPECGRRFTSTTRLCGHRKEAGH